MHNFEELLRLESLFYLLHKTTLRAVIPAGKSEREGVWLREKEGAKQCVRHTIQ